MAKKKKRKQSVQSKQKPARRKMIKESDLYESRVVAPLRRQLRRAQQGRHFRVVDKVWKALQDAQKHHRILADRGTFVKRP